MRQDVAVFVCPGSSAALAVRRATTKVPVVAVGLPPEPFPELFASHERPAGSVTGFAHVGLDLAPARMQMLCELMPSAKKLAILHSRADDLCVAWRDQTSGAALRRGLTATSIGLHPPLLRSSSRFLKWCGRREPKPWLWCAIT